MGTSLAVHTTMAADDGANPLADVHALLDGVTLDAYLAERPPTAVVTVSDAMPLEQVRRGWCVWRGEWRGGSGLAAPAPEHPSNCALSNLLT